jgi:AraC family transcriptional regulator, regulatory protein of adaptative response / methylated-DNA-[protein]-cysteine methyltransferase
VLRRDRSLDGAFWYGVRSTGVYCRPQCPSREPRRENVTFHCSREDAERAGYRPCRRCKPDQAEAEAARAAAIARACRMIETAEEPPSLDALAAAAGLSPFHFHRIFKTVTGTTPKKYAMTHRANRVSQELEGGASVTSAIYDSGFNASSRFYEKANATLGMTASAVRKKGAGERIRYAITACSLGFLLVAATDRGVCAIRFGDDRATLRAELAERFGQAELAEGDASFDATVKSVVAFVEMPKPRFELPLDIQGTAFQQRVWQALQDIPLGRTASYQDVAERIGSPAAVRAVAGACAANPVAVAVPCHRVVKADGALSGYRWGVERKAELLKREGAR